MHRHFSGSLNKIVSFVIFVMCGAGFFPETTLGQNAPDPDQASQKRQERFKHDPDFPVQGTEGQRGEAKQEEAKEEAIRSLPTKGEFSVFPVPAFGYSRNEGAYYGFLVPMLRSNANGHLEDIIAPQYLHNKYIGETLTMNYYGYPSDTTQYRAILSYSTKVQREIDLSYKNVGAGGGGISWRDRLPGLKIPSDDFLESGAKRMNPMKPLILQRKYWWISLSGSIWLRIWPLCEASGSTRYVSGMESSILFQKFKRGFRPLTALTEQIFGGISSHFVMTLGTAN